MRWVLEDYTLCIYIIYIYLNTTSTNSKLSSWFSSSKGGGGLYLCATNKVYIRVLSILNNNTLGILVYLFWRVSVFGKQQRITKKKHNTQPLPGENTKHSGNTVGTGQTLPTTLQQCLDATPGFDSNAKVLRHLVGQQRSLMLTCWESIICSFFFFFRF